MIVKSYLFFILSIIVFIAVFLSGYFIPSSIDSNGNFLPVLMRIPTLVPSVIGIYYGVACIIKYKVSLKAIGAILLNSIFLFFVII